VRSRSRPRVGPWSVLEGGWGGKEVFAVWRTGQGGPGLRTRDLPMNFLRAGTAFRTRSRVEGDGRGCDGDTVWRKEGLLPLSVVEQATGSLALVGQPGSRFSRFGYVCKGLPYHDEHRVHIRRALGLRWSLHGSVYGCHGGAAVVASPVLYRILTHGRGGERVCVC
jgi:hypothetical protein